VNPRERLEAVFGAGNWTVWAATPPPMVGVKYAGGWRWFVGRTLEAAVDRAVATAARLEGVV
jgi:hypothetical protein